MKHKPKTQYSRTENKLLYYPEVLNEVLRLTEERDKVLELGTGAGNYSIMLALNDREVIASDIEQKSLDCTKEKASKLMSEAIENAYRLVSNMKTEIIDAHSIPYENEFDLVFSDGVLEHLKLLDALKEIRKSLKDEGWLIAKTPSDMLLYKIVHFVMNSERSDADESIYSKDMLISYMKRAGFKDVSVKMCGSLKDSIKQRFGIDLPFLNYKFYYLIEGRK